MSKLSEFLGINPMNQNFNLNAGRDWQQMLNQFGPDGKGDIYGQQLLRQNAMDMAPSLNSMLGVQRATGGSNALGMIGALKGQNLATEMSNRGIMNLRSQDYNRWLQAIQGKQGAEQWTKGMQYQQGVGNRAQKGAFANAMIGLGGGLAAGGHLKGLGKFMEGGLARVGGLLGSFAKPRMSPSFDIGTFDNYDDYMS